MKRALLFFFFVSMAFGSNAQDIVYSSLQNMLAGVGDTVTTLSKVRRSINQIYLSGGADYHIYSTENEGISKYLKKRSYAVLYADTLYVNCKRLRYNRYRFGNWFAKAAMVDGHIFFIAQPLGQLASRTLVSKDVPRLQGSVGDAISASGLVYDRVVYEIDPSTGRISFVGQDRMSELLSGRPELLKSFLAENDERADVVIKYLQRLR